MTGEVKQPGVAIVTGGARGLGLAIASRLARDGYSIVIADVDHAAAQAAAAGIPGARARACDVTRKADVDALISAAIAGGQRLAVMVNNAGIAAPGEFLTLSEEHFDRVVAINLKGVFLCAQAAARIMVAQRGEGAPPGSIVSLSSVQSRIAGPEFVPYAATKAGVSQMTAAMAVALAPHGIRVNAVAPGTIMTDMVQSVLTPEAEAAVMARTPLGRIGDADEIAGTVSFLASRDASFITGQTIFVDGGRTSLAFTMPPRAPARRGE